MRMDEVKGGIKVFNGGREKSLDDDDNNSRDEDGVQIHRRLRQHQSDGIATERRKRRSWKPIETPTAVDASIERGPVQLRKTLSEPCSSPPISIKDCQELREDKIVVSSSGDGGEIREKGVLVIGDDDDEEIEIKVEEDVKSFDDKEIDEPVGKQKLGIHQIHEIPVSSDIEKKKLAYMIDPLKKGLDPIKPPTIVEEEEEEDEMLECSSGARRVQSLVDLVMWKDISKSAFVFGCGTFFFLSSSYTRDLNFSFISAISYLGLSYLAAIFLYRSILCRGGAAAFDGTRIVGEVEAIWVLRLLLPYINELLLKIRALFSGDPATTMKLGLLLFVMARCGSSITIWTLAKLVFFGGFTLPKVCSSYSVQLAKYGKFWLERLRDGWESCTHKKAFAAAAFTVVWNLSSTIARFWAVFMLIVAVRFYQQCGIEGLSGGEEEEGEEGEEMVRGGKEGRRF